MIRSKSGFTLIEIVIVLTIVAVLSSIAIPNLRAVREKGEAARIATQLHYIEDAIAEALIDGATESEFARITAANVATSALAPFLTEANLEDVPEGFSLDISSREDGINPGSGHFFVFVTITSPDTGTGILEELEAMFPPHSFGEMGSYFWVGIDSRTLARTEDGG